MNASFLSELAGIFQKQLEQLENEIALFQEELLWTSQPGITNPGGNLALHLVGNLNHYVGAMLGKTGYLRNRENEFSAKNVLSAELISMIRETRKTVVDVLNSFPETGLEQEYPIIVFDKPMSVQYFLIHLSSHLGYHLGQIIDRAQRLTRKKFEFVQQGINEKGLKQQIDQELNK